MVWSHPTRCSGKVGGPDSDNRGEGVSVWPGLGNRKHSSCSQVAWLANLSGSDSFGRGPKRESLERQASVITSIHSPSLSPHLSTPRTSPSVPLPPSAPLFLMLLTEHAHRATAEREPLCLFIRPVQHCSRGDGDCSRPCTVAPRTLWVSLRMTCRFPGKELPLTEIRTPGLGQGAKH